MGYLTVHACCLKSVIVRSCAFSRPKPLSQINIFIGNNYKKCLCACDFIFIAELRLPVATTKPSTAEPESSPVSLSGTSGKRE